MHFASGKYTLQLDTTWRNTPKQDKSQQAHQGLTILLPFIKTIFTAKSDCLTGRNDDEFRQYREALLARKQNWLIHVAGLRLKFAAQYKSKGTPAIIHG